MRKHHWDGKLCLSAPSFVPVPRWHLEQWGRQNTGLRHSTLSLPLGTTVSGASAAPIPSNLPATMHSTPHSPLSSSTSDHPDEALPSSNVLPLRRMPVWSEHLSPLGPSQQRSVPVPETRPQ